MKRILRALAFTGILAVAAAGAQAQAQVRAFVGFRAPVVVAAVPPCPGVGYVWTAGYYNGPAWVPGRWIYRGNGGFYARRDYRFDYRYDHRYYDRHYYRR
jgi:hypothetical protein